MSQLSPVALPKSVHASIQKVLKRKFGASFVDMNVIDFEVHDDRVTFVIEIELKQHRDDHEQSLFGLTRQVRDAMGQFGSDFFPVLRPVAHHA